MSSLASPLIWYKNEDGFKLLLIYLQSILKK